MIICLNPKEESRPTRLAKGRFQVRFAYARARESQKPNGTGQDFVITRVDERRTTFALCDGVGQSFMGDEAARLVAESLVAWLWDRCEDNTHIALSESALIASLTKYLNGLTDYATKRIQKIPLSSELPKLVKEVLIDRREYGGTQTNFVCGFIETRGTRTPNGSVGLFWLGDAKLRVWKAENDITSRLGATWDKNEAWSSQLGVIGKIHCFLGNLNEIDKVMAYSDGMDAVESLLRPGMSDEELESDISLLQARSDSDDVSFLELSYGATHAESNLDGAALAAAMRMHASFDVPRYLNFDGKFSPLQEQINPPVTPPSSEIFPTWHPAPRSKYSGTEPVERADSYDSGHSAKKHPRRQINNLAALSMIGLCLFITMCAVLVIRQDDEVGKPKNTEVIPGVISPVVEKPILTKTIRPKKTKEVHISSTPMPSSVFTSASPSLTQTSTETETFTKTPRSTQTRIPTLPSSPKQLSFIDWLMQIFFPKNGN